VGIREGCRVEVYEGSRVKVREGSTVGLRVGILDGLRVVICVLGSTEQHCSPRNTCPFSKQLC